MPRLVTDFVELAVGAVCLGVAVATWRRGVRLVAVLFAVAGGVAVAHAIWSMSGS